MEMLLSVQVDAAQSAPPFSDQLEAKGFHLLLDSQQFYGGARPGKVIVANARTIEQRGEELRAFLRACIRGFWFIRDRANFARVQDLERRLREASHNEDERRLRMVTDPDKVEAWVMPLAGAFGHEAIAGVIDEMVTLGQLERPITVDAVVRDGPVNDAYRDVSTRPQLQASVRTSQALIEKYGY
jgi:ABC-type nitrate/sulfonate/bicarbonate transport system substrate-binding protein